MGKEGDLWDDSALINAFNSSISKYKAMHGISPSKKGKSADDNAQECLPASQLVASTKEVGSNTEVEQNGNEVNDSSKTTPENGETAKLLTSEENNPLELTSSKNHAGTSNGQTGISLSSENPTTSPVLPVKHAVSSDTKSWNEALSYSNGQEEYNQLLNKYYEIEDQRQRVLHQLNQYNDWYYQNPEQYQACGPQQYNTVTCSCTYGCQSWVVPCNMSSTSCLGGSCTDKNCHGTIKDDQKVKENFVSQTQQDHGFVQTAMAAAKTALSSLTLEASGCADSTVKGIDSATEIDNITKSTDPATDLAVVLNAWYSAGFYTGKYMSEQSFEKRK